MITDEENKDRTTRVLLREHEISGEEVVKRVLFAKYYYIDMISKGMQMGYNGRYKKN